VLSGKEPVSIRGFESFVAVVPLVAAAPRDGRVDSKVDAQAEGRGEGLLVVRKGLAHDALFRSMSVASRLASTPSPTSPPRVTACWSAKPLDGGTERLTMACLLLFR
jgi:hypothetical protein